MDAEEIKSIMRQFKHGAADSEWKQYIKSIKITNIHGWTGQEIAFNFPVVAIVGENGIGKSTFLKASVCAYKNKNGQTFYPSKMFVSTRWDATGLQNAIIEYKVRKGNEDINLRWKKTNDWGFTPKQGKPERNVFFLDISRTLPLDATAGYAKVAKLASKEVGAVTELTPESLQNLSYILGQQYGRARFVGTDVDVDICKKLTDKGFIIVSAFDNLGALSYPASFDCVIGVLTGELCFSVNDFEYFENDIVNLGASGLSQRLPWKGDHEFRIISGNSLSCAYVSGKIIQLLHNEHVAKNQILKAFKNSAKKIHTNTCVPVMPNNIFKIKKAALFPFNKEMHSILRFEDKLDFEITDVYDTKYSLRVGKNTNKEVKSDSSGHIIKNIEKIDWDSFDTLILGHIDMLILQMKSYDFKNNLISEALRHNKQIYSFDDLGQIVKNNKRVQSPTILPEHLPPFRYEKLHENIVPVVGVFGTGGRQGKFTLQVTLRNCLRNKGFKVGQIGTEPSALLFGMEYVFPIGYETS